MCDVIRDCRNVDRKIASSSAFSILIILSRNKSRGSVVWRNHENVHLTGIWVICFKLMESKVSLFWRRKWQPTPVFLPGESHRQRSLVGCSPWGRKESGMTKQLTTHKF